MVGQGLGIPLSRAEARGMTGCSHAAVPGQEVLQPGQQLGEFPAVILWMPNMDWSIQLLLL